MSPAILGEMLYVLRLGVLQPLYYELDMPVKSEEANSRLLCSLRCVCSVGPVCTPLPQFTRQAPYDTTAFEETVVLMAAGSPRC